MYLTVIARSQATKQFPGERCIVDASIMPHNVTANLNVPVIVLAERISGLILRKQLIEPTSQ